MNVQELIIKLQELPEECKDMAISVYNDGPDLAEIKDIEINTMNGEIIEIVLTQYED